MDIFKWKYIRHVKTLKNRLNLQKFVELAPSLVYNSKENRLIVFSSADFLFTARMYDVLCK